MGALVTKLTLLLTAHSKAENSDHRGTEYTKALQLRSKIETEFHNTMCNFSQAATLDGEANRYHALLLPAAVTPAPTLGWRVLESDEFLNDVMTVPISLAQLPAVSVPLDGLRQPDDTDLPMGVQLVGPYGSDSFLLQMADIVNKAN